MEKKLNEELLRQLLLMNFDRGKTLLEQKPDEVNARTNRDYGLRSR